MCMGGDAYHDELMSMFMDFSDRRAEAQTLWETRKKVAKWRAEGEAAGAKEWWLLALQGFTAKHLAKWEQFVAAFFPDNKVEGPSTVELTRGNPVTDNEWHLEPGLKLRPLEILDYVKRWDMQSATTAMVIRMKLPTRVDRLARFQKESAETWTLAAQGMRWLKDVMGQHDFYSKYKPTSLRGVVKLAELGENLAHAAVHELSRESLAAGPRFDDLRHDLLKLIERQPRQLVPLLPVAKQWKHLMPDVPFKLNEGSKVSSLSGFKCGVLVRIIKEFDVLEDPPQLKRAKARNTPAYHLFGMNQSRAQELEANISAIFQLVRLFRDYEAVKRFVGAAGHDWSLKGVHDAGQFALPKESNWSQPAWASKCLRVPEMVQHAGFFGQLDEHGFDPKNTRELKRDVVLCGYPAATPGFEALLHACADAGLSPSSYRSHLKFWQGLKPRNADYLPDVVVNGAEVGLDDQWQFTKLKAGDFRGPLLGVLTGCCQHLEGAGRESAISGVSDPNAGFYVVTRNGVVMAQCWAWRNSTNGVVFDSWESIYRDEVCINAFAELIKVAAQRLVQVDNSVQGVFLGSTSSGVTAQVAQAMDISGKAEEYQTQTLAKDGYYDGARHHLLAGTTVAGSLVPKNEDVFLNLDELATQIVADVEERNDGTYADLEAYLMDAPARQVRELLHHPHLSPANRMRIWDLTPRRREEFARMWE